MPETLYGEFTTTADDVAEFTLFDDDDNKQCYARYPKDELPGNAEPGDVFTMTVDENDQEIIDLEPNPEKTTEFKQQREAVLDDLV